MGTIVSQLGYLYCKSGCQASVVASALTFHPPMPFYKITFNDATGVYDIEFSPQTAHIEYEDLTVELVRTKSKTTIPILCLRYPDAKFTLIYSHGNATDCGAMFIMYAMIAMTLKINVVGYDYTGYGSSMASGIKPTEKQTYKDIERVYEWCIENRIVQDPAKEILVYGQSVGSGPSCYLAATKPVGGLILHSPIMSGIRVLTASRLMSCLDIYPNIDRIRKVKCPVFIIHGMEDIEVDVSHGLSLLEAVSIHYRTNPWWVPNRGHNDVLVGNEKEFFRRMAVFMEYVQNRPKIEENKRLVRDSKRF